MSNPPYNAHYQAILSAAKGTPLANLGEFIEHKFPIYEQYLDDNFLYELKHNPTGFYARYWELLSCCLLREACNLKFNKPTFKKGTSNYDLDLEVNGQKIALENTICQNADNEEDKVPEDKFGSGSSGHHEKIQIRIANAVSTKKKQYKKLLDDGNISPDQPYILAIGLYELAHFSSGQIGLFLYAPFYLGAFFPVGYPLFYIEHPGTKVSETEEKINPDTSLPNVSVEEWNYKANDSPVSKGVFLCPENSFISAILLSARADGKIINGFEPKPTVYNDFILIHNPLAKNKLPISPFPVQHEHVTEITINSKVITTVNKDMSSNGYTFSE